MGPQLKGAIIPVLKQGLFVNAEKFFGLLDGDPAGMLRHR